MSNVEPIDPFKPIGEAAAKVAARVKKGMVIEWDGKTITKDGRYANLPIEIYHGPCTNGAGISSSGLRTIESRTPLHYWSRSYLNPNREPEEPKDYFDLGKAAHMRLLGESGFAEKFAIRPDQWSDWRTKAAQEWRDEQRALGKSILTHPDLKTIERMESSLRADPLVRSGILDGSVEHSLIWRDLKTGVWLKSRPDVIPSADGVLVDLKTTTDASHDAVSRAIADHGYAMQGALAAMGMKHVMDVTMTDFVLVFVEKTPPYAVNTVVIDPAWIFWAMRQVRRAIDRFSECLSKNEWPGYESERTVSMPAWLEKRFESEDKTGTLPEESAA